jgi:hypothetical protein
MCQTSGRELRVREGRENSARPQRERAMDGAGNGWGFSNGESYGVALPNALGPRAHAAQNRRRACPASCRGPTLGVCPPRIVPKEFFVAAS